MSKELKLAVAMFPAINWNTGLAEDLRADLLELHLGRELAALGGKIIQEDGQLKIVQAADANLELYDQGHQKVNLDALFQKVQSQASFKSLTAEGQPQPAPLQPGQLPEPKTNSEAMRKAYRDSQDALAEFRRNQQEQADSAQRLAESAGKPLQMPDKPYEAVNHAFESRKRAAAESLADFKRNNQQ